MSPNAHQPTSDRLALRTPVTAHAEEAFPYPPTSMIPPNEG